jgi:HSP20 family protein
MSALRAAIADLPDPVFADVLEGDDAYLLVVDLPGVTAATLDVTARDGGVAIEARRAKAAPEGFTYEREDRQTFLDVTLPLPGDADSERASGSIDRGVLELTVPKRESTTGTEIEIDAA